MGLDMYLMATKHEHFESDTKLDGMPLSSSSYEVGYWRKHPDLHGYIVSTYANSVDECQRIDLEYEDIESIIKRLRSAKPLDVTQGFFFGASDGTLEEREEEALVFEKALVWAQKHNAYIYYQASW